jgi:hypothetical protein
MSYLKFLKDGNEKIVDEQWKKQLLADGWKVEGEDDLSALWEEAEALGLKLHHKTGREKLIEAIEKAKENADR